MPLVFYLDTVMLLPLGQVFHYLSSESVEVSDWETLKRTRSSRALWNMPPSRLSIWNPIISSLSGLGDAMTIKEK